MVSDATPISRSEALAEPATNPVECTIRVMVPKVILERGGLAQRSLRIFGVVRRYQGGALTGSFSAFTSGPMLGFKLAGPADVPTATALVEQAYKTAVESFLENSSKSLGQ